MPADAPRSSDDYHVPAGDLLGDELDAALASANTGSSEDYSFLDWSICDPCKRADHLGCVMAGPNEECCCAE